MATTTANQAIRIPQTTDDPDVVDDITKAVLDLEKRVVMVFDNSSDRSSRVPTPTEGMLSYLKDTDLYYFYSGTAWTALVPSVPTFSSGTAVPSNSSGNNGDIFFKV